VDGPPDGLGECVALQEEVSLQDWLSINDSLIHDGDSTELDLPRIEDVAISL